jgi:hypothetical protein
LVVAKVVKAEDCKITIDGEEIDAIVGQDFDLFGSEEDDLDTYLNRVEPLPEKRERKSKPLTTSLGDKLKEAIK